MTRNIERLKKAQARGAKVQYFGSFSEKWYYVHETSWRSTTEYRIVDNHKQLQYGPISKALLNAVTYGEDREWFVKDLTLELRMAIMYMLRELVDEDDPNLPPEALSSWKTEDLWMLALFVVEDLADRGM